MDFQTVNQRTWFLLGLLIIITMVVSSFQHLPPDTTSAQQQLKIATALVEQEKYDLAVPQLLEALAVFEQAEDWVQWLEVCRQLDECYTGLDELEEGIKFLQTALGKVEGLQKAAYFKTNLLLLLAIFYHTKGDYINAGQYYEQGLELAEARKETQLLPAYYSSLSLIYWDSGDYLKALELQKKSLQIAISQKHTANIPELLYFIGDTYRTLNDRQALDYFRRCLALNPEDKNEKIIQLSKVYQQFDMFDSAFIVLDQILPTLQDDVEKADCYYQYARLYQELKNFPQAISWIRKALPHGLNGYGKKHTEYARMTSLAGAIYLAAGHADEALSWFHKTLNNQSSAAVVDSLTANPPLDDLPSGSIWVLSSLTGKGEALYQKYRQKGQPENLQVALNAFDLALSYGEKMRLSYGHESSKIELYEYLKPAVEGCIKTTLALAEQQGEPALYEKAFLYAERVKSAAMAEALYDKDVKHLANIDEAVLEKEKAFNEAVTNWETGVYFEEDPELKSAYKDSLAEAQFQLSKLKGTIEKEFPRYFELKYAFQKKADLKHIQQNIAEGSLLIEYFMGDSTLYTFAVSKDELKAYAAPKTATLAETLTQFRRSISDFKFIEDSSTLAEQNFLTTAYSLYDLLLARPLSEIKAQKLIIVTDGNLGQISFNALLTAPYQGSWKDRDVPYLVKDYALRHAWSATTLEHKKTDAAVACDFGGFGTEYDEVTLAWMNKKHTADTLRALAWRDFGHLPAAAKEVENISKHLRGKIWLNEAATKENFLAEAPTCGALHLAMHSVLNEENPMLTSLVFNKSAASDDNQLFASELYNLDLKARLAVISVCNSGYGEALGSEGNMSLARAFAYAGCPTLVSSLWKSNDQSTAELMQYFYQKLSEGLAIDEALRAAKLQYLQHTTAEYSLPIYWAGFIMIGDDTPLPASFFDTGINWAWYGIAGALLILGVLYWRFRKAKA